jgi:putative glycosyltransferase (TIGR04372 family)
VTEKLSRHIPPTFGVPTVMTNSVPMSHAFWLVCGKHSLFIPKLAWSVEQQRYLTFAEHLQPPVDGVTYRHQLDPAGIKMVDKTPEEIKEAVVKMLELLEGKSSFTAEDEALLLRLNALSPTYQAYGFCNRMGRDFLRKYGYLLSEQAT